MGSREGSVNGVPAGRVVLFAVCGHMALFRTASLAIREGDVLICVRCNRERVVHQIGKEVRVRCEVCTYSRGFMLSKLAASVEAIQHCKRTHHSTTVLVGGYVRERYKGGPMPGQASTDELTDIPPF